MTEKIPKIIHYVWVGNNKFTPLAEKCLESWKKFLPDYEIKLWNEETLPKEVFKHPYVQKKYQEKKWAFVSDYIRFFVLEKYGGIYLDTDTEVLKSFDSLLDNEAFFGKTKDGMVAAGVIGATKNHLAIKTMLLEYDKDITKDTVRTSPMIVTEVLKNPLFENLQVFNYQYFNPCDDGEKCTAEKLSLAYTNNHWAESWVSFAKLRKVARRLGVMNFIKKNLGKN